jgi:hypothetical protein
MCGVGLRCTVFVYSRASGERASVIFFDRLTVCTEGGIVRLDVADLVVLGLDG